MLLTYNLNIKYETLLSSPIYQFNIRDSLYITDPNFIFTLIMLSLIINLIVIIPYAFTSINNFILVFF